MQKDLCLYTGSADDLIIGLRRQLVNTQVKHGEDGKTSGHAQGEQTDIRHLENSEHSGNERKSKGNMYSRS